MPELIGNVLSWASDVDPGAIEQAARASRMPFVEGHVALMPDAHVGIGATIGSVIPTKSAVIPAAVGVDIGCGMIASETDLVAEDLPDDLGRLLRLVESRVPAGVGRGHDRAQTVASELGLPQGSARMLTDRQLTKIGEQFGTLGSGNHFFEVCLDERDHVWIVLHSGSRGIGNELARRHIDRAKGLMKQALVKLEDPDLAYLAQGTPEFEAYIADMLWCQDYAFKSRQQMMNEGLRSLFEVVGHGHVERTVNCHHNFSQLERHGDADLWITRKGAIKAGVDDLGVIPGSMGTQSYVVRGKGNPASYSSCSHGAGRRMSRGEAKRRLTPEGLRERMAGKTWNADRAKHLVDEHPDAYKSIDQVMADQEDLVEVVHTLRQVLNYKGQ